MEAQTQRFQELVSQETTKASTNAFIKVSVCVCVFVQTQGFQDLVSQKTTKASTNDFIKVSVCVCLSLCVCVCECVCVDPEVSGPRLTWDL